MKKYASYNIKSNGICEINAKTVPNLPFPVDIKFLEIDRAAGFCLPTSQRFLTSLQSGFLF